MRAPLRLALRCASVALFAIVNAAALTFGSGGQARPVLIACGIIAVAAAAQSALWESDGQAALLLSLPPLLPLTAGSFPWLMGPLGGLLLLACELNSVSWESTARGTAGVLVRRRLAAVTLLTAGGIAASILVVVAAGAGPPLRGTAALIVAAAAMAGVGILIFGRGQRPPSPSPDRDTAGRG